MDRLRSKASRTQVFAVSIAGFVLAAMAQLASAAPVQVDIRKFAFSPQEVTIPPGTTVRWINDDETPHTIAAENAGFTSPGLDTGDGYEHTFDKEGDVTYFCSVHPFMKGVVHIRKP
ncbi:MAG TPA: cupredoxin family copper-binding protein [Rhodanobacteraceae bacterium]|jgi:plastocyanin|nr:cupredoxin family copper-binding protein [Rhodanobacteraceae bacterium]